MHSRLTLLVVAAAVVAALGACKKAEPPPPPAPPPTKQLTWPVSRSDVPAPPDVKAPPADAKTLPSGVASKVVRDGAGKEHPTPDDTVKIHYVTWTGDGRFLKTTRTGQPEVFLLGKSIKGWVEGIPQMVVGEVRRFWIPNELANPAAPPGESKLQVYEVELLEIQKAAPLPTGELAPAKDATTSKTGLIYKVLKKGKGKVHPKASNTVEVHYTGWTSDGKEYDSSVKRGKPTKMPATGPLAGWGEAMSLMVVGDKARFWFSPKLAFGDPPPPNAPAGMMVFDIELLGIE
jgi:peptidylprolyl isomerase